MKYKNIYEKIKKEIKEREEKAIKEMEKGNYLYAYRYIEKDKPYKTNEKKKLLKRIKEITKRKLEVEKGALNRIANANEEINGVIIVEWKKSRMWGANPSASYNNKYYSGTISGCGYDKLSTAIAYVLNQNAAIKKRLYDIKEKNINTGNQDLFGYGSGYGIKPYFEGGVGIQSLIRVLERIGIKVDWVSSDNTDVFTLKVVK